MFRLRLARTQGYRQRSANRSYSAIQRQLADRKNVNQMLRIAQVAVCAENTERERQVEASAFSAHVSRREIDRSLVKGKKERAVVNRSANAFARFPHGEIGEAEKDHRSGRVGLVPHWRQINFHVDE